MTQKYNLECCVWWDCTVICLTVLLIYCAGSFRNNEQILKINCMKTNYYLRLIYRSFNKEKCEVLLMINWLVACVVTRSYILHCYKPMDRQRRRRRSHFSSLVFQVTKHTCGFYLWGYIKDSVYIPPLPATLQELRVCIRKSVESITPEVYPEYGRKSTNDSMCVVLHMGYMSIVFYVSKKLQNYFYSSVSFNNC